MYHVGSGMRNFSDIVVTSPVPQCHVLGNLLWSLNCYWINGVGVSKWNELLFCISGFCICYLVFVSENGLCLIIGHNQADI